MQFDLREELLASTANMQSTVGRGPGRPIGTKNNKPRVPGWHDEVEAAELLGESVPTRRRNRRRGIGPRWTRHGRRVMHPDGAEADYLAAQLAKAEAAASPRRRGRPRGP
jgi:hypothetical protein